MKWTLAWATINTYYHHGANMDATAIQKYINDVKEELGKSWVEESAKHGITAKSLGGVAYEYSVHCFMTGVAVKECSKIIKTRFPEEKK